MFRKYHESLQAHRTPNVQSSKSFLAKIWQTTAMLHKPWLGIEGVWNAGQFGQSLVLDWMPKQATQEERLRKRAVEPTPWHARMDDVFLAALSPPVQQLGKWAGRCPKRSRFSAPCHLH